MHPLLVLAARDDQSVSLWTVVLVLAIIALLVFIFTRFRR